jgi:chromosome partition protein MukB
VNWSGVFYERYRLDRHVTALEGVNGAGKTTALVAAYVCLLPDLTRLRFAPVAEGGAAAGDRGLYGRLGDPGSPSYAALDLRLASGERLVAGVELERRAEPAVELSTFAILGLPDAASLADVFLHRRDQEDEVVDLNGLRERAALAGGRLKPFDSAKEYFAMLFEAGVLPLRLATDEDRNKLNEMLRTSLFGGISKSLTGDLRDFLLKEQSDLGDTLRAMRANLEACRRTRHEVAEARQLEAEIGRVFAAGQTMFAAALHATRARLDEMSRGAEEARKVFQTAADKAKEAEGALAIVRAEHESAVEARDGCLSELAAERDALDRTRRATDVQRRIDGLIAERAEVVARLEDASRDLEEAERVRREARAREARAADDERAAAEGLADAQRGVQELARRAGLHRRVVAERGRATEALGIRAADAGGFEEAARRCHAELRATDAALAALDRHCTLAETRRAEFARVLAALSHLMGNDVAVGEAHGVALTALERLRERAALAVELPDLPKRIEEERRLAARQDAVRAGAAALGSTGGPLDRAAAVRAAHAEAEARAERAALDAAAGERSAAGERDIEAGARAALDAIDALAARWREARESAAQLAEIGKVPVDGATALERCAAELRRRRDVAVAERASSVAARDRRLAEASRLEGVGAFSDDVLRARDAVDGEFLAGRLEQLPVDEAPEIEARLGPLASAILVDDTGAAVQKLLREPARPANVWLVDAHALSEWSDVAPSAEVRDGNAIVRESSALRVTRIPEQPVLGHAARRAAATRARTEADAVGQQAEALAGDAARLEMAIALAVRLARDGALLERRDPSAEVAAARAAANEAAERRRCFEKSASVARDAETAARRRVRELSAILPDAHLLDGPDHRAEADGLIRRYAEARKAREEIAVAGEDRAIVSRELDVLRDPPPDVAEVERLRGEMARCAARRDALASASTALAFVADHAEALSWEDAEARLAAAEQVAPALRAQYDEATTALVGARERLQAADVAHTVANARWLEIDGKVKLCDTDLARRRVEFAECGVDEVGDDVVARRLELVEALGSRIAVLNDAERELLLRESHAERTRSEAAADEERCRTRLADEERKVPPAAERWERLRERAEGARVLAGATAETTRAALGASGSIDLWRRAEASARELVIELRHARDGEPVVPDIERAIAAADETAEAPRGELYLESWLRARSWLKRRVPPVISEVEDPVDALARVGEHLKRLQSRLEGQERDLRGRSEDVARNIDAQLRRAGREVTRLNRDLGDVRFGNIDGVQIESRRVEHMERVLGALREGAAQALLFEPDVPFEEALEELFRRHGGGRIGGHKLLDYREYVHLRVMVRRRATGAWEEATPGRLSTGENIGVGAAVMMVVLTAWERDANLFRARSTHGSLRFLFLDEATRLSPDNLGVLFELCQNLDLQLLIAAPEVASAEGNTTYRLVRTVDERGRETVHVTGRRAVARA